MFAPLLRNIAISGVAYAIVSGVGLFLAPLLIATYGLAGYGQILVARTFLPSGLFALFDVGVSENATRRVASARSTMRWDDLSAALTMLAVVAVVIGCVIGAAMFAGAGLIGNAFSIPIEERDGFQKIIELSAVLQPVLLLSLVAEGVLKGFERFDWMRTIEVVAAGVYCALAVTVVACGYGPNWIAIALLMSLLIRFAIAAALAWRLLARETVRFRIWDREVRREVMGWSVTMLGSKLIGVLQNQIASPLIGLLLGPAAVGLYDAVVRLPRFVKSLFGLISSTVFPLASRLRSDNDEGGTGKLAYYGILGAVLVTWPAAITAAIFSRPILSVWLDASIADHWPWQSVMFLITMLAVPISFGSSMALADREATVRLLRIAAIQSIGQLALALVLVERMGPWAFVLANALAVILTFPWQMVAMHKALTMRRSLSLRFVAIVAIASLVSAATIWLKVPGTIWELGLLGGVAAGVGTIASLLACLTIAERQLLLGVVRRSAVRRS